MHTIYFYLIHTLLLPLTLLETLQSHSLPNSRPFYPFFFLIIHWFHFVLSIESSTRASTYRTPHPWRKLTLKSLPSTVHSSPGRGKDLCVLLASVLECWLAGSHAGLGLAAPAAAMSQVRWSCLVQKAVYAPVLLVLCSYGLSVVSVMQMSHYSWASKGMGSVQRGFSDEVRTALIMGIDKWI